MANIDAPFGFRPSGKVGGNPHNGALSQYTILDGESSTMFQGDMVEFASGGVIDAAPGDTGLMVFNGIQYDDPTTGKPTFKNQYDGVDLNKNIEIAKEFKDDIAKSINVEGMDEADKLKTVGRLSRNKKFMMQVSQAYEEYKAANTKGGMGPNQFISTYIKQIVEQDPTSREKDYIPNFGLFS